MASFRFCRPDDANLLIEAVNACYNPHFSIEDLTREEFNREINLINVWSSSCMVVLEGKTPIGVLTACKREDFSLITRVGVHPNHRRKGYAEHMLTSLRDKMKILGPPVLFMEVPGSKNETQEFFLKQGYSLENTYQDYQKVGFEEKRELLDWVVDLEMDQIADTISRKKINSEIGEGNLAWERQLQTLQNCHQKLISIGIAGMEGIEAYVNFQKADEQLYTGPVDNIPPSKKHENRVVLLGMGCDDHDKFLVYMYTLLTWIGEYAFKNWKCEKSKLEFFIPKISELEIPDNLLESLGFKKGAKYHRLSLSL